MIDWKSQVSSGKLVCPKTRQKLFFDSNTLFTLDGLNKYPISDSNVPILLTDKEGATSYVKNSKKMIAEYARSSKNNIRNKLRSQILRQLLKDYRTKKSRDAFNHVIASLPSETLCLSIGGGAT